MASGILIADGHPLFRQGVRLLLDDLGAGNDVLEAENFAGTVEAVTRRPGLSLVLLGLRMPDMLPLSGLDAVRSSYAGSIAVVSAIEDKATIKAVLSRGIVGYILKTLPVGVVRAALDVVLAGETFFPARLLSGAGNGIDCTSLTARERDVLDLLRMGLPNKVIATHLAISEVTVKTHLSSAFRKLGVRNRTQASQAWSTGESPVALPMIKEPAAPGWCGPAIAR